MNEAHEFDSQQSGHRDDLVAYLDGELDSENAGAIESLLATDPVSRDKLHGLDRAWGLLDFLPRAEVDELFTQSTIEMVALSAAEEVRLIQNAEPKRRLRRLLIAMVACLVAGVGGYFGLNWLWPDPNAELLRDLPLVERLNQYDQVGSLEFARLLLEKVPEIAAPRDAAVSDESAEDPRSRIEELTADEKDSLLRNKQRFDQLNPAEQERLRQLHDEFKEQPDASALQATLAGYHGWLLKNTTPPQRSGLLDLDPQARIERIAKLHQEDQQRQRRLSENRLSPADLDAFVGWLEDQVRARLTLNPNLRRILDLAPEERRFALMWMAPQLWMFGFPPLRLPEFTAADLDDLRSRLSEEGRSKLVKSSLSDQRRRITGWSGWMWQAINDSKARFKKHVEQEVQSQDLVTYFDSLSSELKERLLTQSPEERQEKLRQMWYLQSRNLDKDPPFSRLFDPDGWSRGSSSGFRGRPSFGEGREGGPPSGSRPPGPGQGREGQGRDGQGREGPPRRIESPPA